MMVFLLLLLLFGQCAAQPSTSEVLARLREIKQAVADLEALVHQWLPDMMNEEAPQEEHSDVVPAQSDYAQKHESYWTKDQEKNRLKEIEDDLIENPLGAKQRRMLKQFVLQVKNETVKSEALFFLGEVYYLRQKLTGGKKGDNKKALGLFSRSYSLDPHSSRTPKALVRVAQCLAKDAKYEEAQSILQKIKAEHGRELGFDLERECDKVLEVCNNN